MLVENLPVVSGLDSLTVCSVGELNVAVGWVANVPVLFQSDDVLCNSSLDEAVALTL